MCASKSKPKVKAKPKRNEVLGEDVIREVLNASLPRPDQNAKPHEKTNYAVRFAERMAECIARDLRAFRDLKETKATSQRDAASVRGPKQLDVNFSPRALGLALGISLKSVHIRESGGRYTHNMKRNDEELRIEAMGYHKRHPYAVMVGVLFLPYDSCDDGKRGNSSSFGSWVQYLRPAAGRSGPHDDNDLFERVYVALYEPNGADLRFFDVAAAPPKNQRPARLLSYEEFLEATYHDYLRRNALDFQWASGEEAPLEPEGPSDGERLIEDASVEDGEFPAGGGGTG